MEPKSSFNLKERKPLLIKILVVVLLVLLCCNLPGEILFWKLCTEQDRELPPHSEVLVSACKKPVATGVPGGEVLFVHENRSGRMYLLDLRTGEKRKVPNDPLLLEEGIFLSSDLVWLEGSLDPGNSGYRPHYILDLTDGKRYQLTDLSSWIDQPPPPNYVPYFQSAEQIFIHHTNNRAIALPPDFRQNSEEGVILHKSHLNKGTDFENGEFLEQLMKDLGVDYEIVDLSLAYADIPSPTGRYVVRNDGIYFSGTDFSIVNREYTGGRFMGRYFKGWYYDESGVVVQGFTDYLFTTLLGGRFIPISRPILKLNLPVSP
jgi:hypothetical protein